MCDACRDGKASLEQWRNDQADVIEKRDELSRDDALRAADALLVRGTAGIVMDRTNDPGATLKAFAAAVADEVLERMGGPEAVAAVAAFMEKVVDDHRKSEEAARIAMLTTRDVPQC